MLGDMKIKINRNLRDLFYFIPLLSTIILYGCIVDIPSTRPDGPSVVIYGNVINNDTEGPIPNAVVSDGFSTTLTDNNGEYRFKTFPGASHVFVSVPEQYEIPINKEGMPQIFAEIDTSKDLVKVNFRLTPLKNGKEENFTLVAITDIHVHNPLLLERLEKESLAEMKKLFGGQDNVYGLTLGDLVSDNPEFLVNIKQAFISTNIPFFHTIGNHDFSGNIYEPIEASKEFVSNFGPLNFSFNRGDVHLIVMNNVYNYGVTASRGFSEEQIKWLKSDLNHVPKDKMLIISVHAPILPNSSMERRLDFLDALSDFNEIHIISGDWHYNRNIINTDLNIFEHMTASAIGMTPGIIINKCGAPIGYGVYEISGDRMKNWYYKSINYDKDHQITMLAPHTFEDKDGYVIANVWNADKDWKIEMIEDGVDRGEMEQFTDIAPEVLMIIKSNYVRENDKMYHKTENLFRMKPINIEAEIKIKVTDRFGNIYMQSIPLSNLQTMVRK